MLLNSLRSHTARKITENGDSRNGVISWTWAGFACLRVTEACHDSLWHIILSRGASKVSPAKMKLNYFLAGFSKRTAVNYCMINTEHGSTQLKPIGTNFKPCSWQCWPLLYELHFIFQLTQFLIHDKPFENKYIDNNYLLQHFPPSLGNEFLAKLLLFLF